METPSKRKLGDLLVDYKKITEGERDEALNKQRISGKRLGELLIEESIINEEDLLDILEMQLGVPRVYFDAVDVDYRAVKAIPESLANRHTLIPIGFYENRIQVVTQDPLNIFALDDVRISSGYEVAPLLASREEIKKAIDKYYSREYVQKAAAELTKEQSSQPEKNEDKSGLDEIKNAPAVRMIDSIIKNAVKSRASDVHMEPFEKYVKIRYRIDGELQEIFRSPKETLPALVTRIKILASLNIAEKRIPQDGRILMQMEDRDIDLRISILPTVFGEKVVIRILSRDSLLVDKKSLGMLEADLEVLERIIKTPYGIILVTGPTGSGKSTTLYAVLKELNTVEKNIITVEDPVEYMIEGINQVNVNVKAGLTFAAGLRSILRQDPDIVMVGEIRDGETAEIAIRAAITGHHVLSTIHTNDAPSAVVRLVDMGIEPYLVATSIAGVIAQRLVRKLCTSCRIKYGATEYEKNILGIDYAGELSLYMAKGCPACNNTGYAGRIGVYEIMEISRKTREMILENRNTDELRDLCIGEGMKTLRQSCRELVLNGTTTFEELVKIAYLKE